MEARIDWLWSVVVDRLGDIRVHLDEVQPSLTSGALAERLLNRPGIRGDCST